MEEFFLRAESGTPSIASKESNLCRGVQTWSSSTDQCDSLRLKTDGSISSRNKFFNMKTTFLPGLFEALRTTCARPCLAQSPYLAPTRYVPHRYRVTSSQEITPREIALELKVPIEYSLQVAAPAMAALVSGPCWLIPVPASNGNVHANLRLARAIAGILTTARVICAISRAHPVESSHRRRSRGLPDSASKTMRSSVSCRRWSRCPHTLWTT